MRRSIYDIFHKAAEGATLEEIIKNAGCDYTVKKVPMFYRTADVATFDTALGKVVVTPGTEVGVKRYMANIRTDTEAQLGVVGADFGNIQNVEAFDFTKVLVDENNAEYVSCGSIGAGERVFLVMKTKDFLSLGPNDNVHCYFFFTTAHDGTGFMEVIPTPYRPANGTIMMLPGLTGVRFRHSKHVTARLGSAKQALGKVKDFWTEASTTFNALATLRVTDEQAKTYFMMLVEGDSTRAENIRDKMFQLFKFTAVGHGLPALSGTLLGCYMAAIEYADHYKTVRKAKHLDETSAKVMSRLMGDTARAKAEAYSMVLNLQSKLAGVTL